VVGRACVVFAAEPLDAVVWLVVPVLHVGKPPFVSFCLEGTQDQGGSIPEQRAVRGEGCPAGAVRSHAGRERDPAGAPTAGWGGSCPGPGALGSYRADSCGVSPPGAIVIAQAIVPTALGACCAGLVGLCWTGSVQLPAVKATYGTRPHGRSGKCYGGVAQSEATA
jgi:hypothetical protein